MTRWAFLCCFVVTIPWGHLRAGPTDDRPKPNLFEVSLADGTTTNGGLMEVGDKWSIRLDGAALQPIRGDELISLSRARARLPAFPRGEQVILANGDRLAGTVVRLAGEHLVFFPQITPEHELSIPLSAIAIIWMAPAGDVDGPRQLTPHSRSKDFVYLRNGDVLEGIVSDLDRSTRLRVEVAKKDVAVEFDNVAAIAFNSELLKTLRPRDPYARLVLADGSRLSLVSARSNGVTLQGATLFGATVTLPVQEITALKLFQSRAIYLSDLKPSGYESRPYLNARWPFVADGAIGGGDLRLSGSTYDKGLSMHSASRLTYSLGGGFRRFEALVGLDDGNPSVASVCLAVRLDGKAQDLGPCQKLTSKISSQWIRLNTSGAKELTLEADFGHYFDVQGRVNWVDARLIK
jgi:hypothetical protein